MVLLSKIKTLYQNPLRVDVVGLGAKLPPVYDREPSIDEMTILYGELESCYLLKQAFTAIFGQ